MGVRTITMGSKMKVKEKRGGRKKCPEGNKCPYKHEYQHDLEYTHEDDLNTNEKSKKARSKSPAAKFTGGGQRLGESVSLRNSFLPNPNNVIPSSSSSISSSSSNPKKIKNRIPRAVIAIAATARENHAPSILSNNGAGGCGRDGSGIFINKTHPSENKAFSKLVPNLHLGPSTTSLNCNIMTSSDAPLRLKNDGAIELLYDIDSFNSGSSNATKSNRNNTNNYCPTDEKTRKKMEVIHLDSDDEEDEIVFLGQTDSTSNNIRNKSNYSSDSNDYSSTSASIRSSTSSSSNSSDKNYSSSTNNRSDFNTGRRESYPEIINANSRGQDSNSSSNNTSNRSNYSSDSNSFCPTSASLPFSSSTYRSDFNAGRRESYPEIINVKRGQDSNSSSNNTSNRSNYSSDSNGYCPTSASLPFSSSTYSSNYNTGRRESYPEIVSVESRGQDSNSNGSIINNRSKHSGVINDHISSGVSSLSSSSSTTSTNYSSSYNTGRRDSYPEIIDVNYRGHAGRGMNLTSTNYSSSSSGDVSNPSSILFDSYDARNIFIDESNGGYQSSSSNLTAKQTSSSSSPIIADEMLKVVCEICSKRVSESIFDSLLTTLHSVLY